ncbi:unnamed protein product (macronuclear) [Paramecium tetraurelia]|uniref:Uncharacterized protein n=1 Tax=Paramecium tetraurelia TaxID=5888 RepID=A0CP17_PARTE|nr:uncharacterized protein GSPATT00008925001 [Paramecium tetraurelia]CAK72534.1 unnamed protein product [Paramecium tetraurelia]|eukprot:XP_001439931.1 hypothetical protein (macronuclear) [Paramecium tetraurelia strain d4-2]
MNQENAKLKKTKDSILIKKNGKYSEEVRELARKRAIYILVIECGILITYLIFLIAYSIQDKFKMLFLIIQIGVVLILYFNQGFLLNSFNLFLCSLINFFQRIHNIQKFQLVKCIFYYLQECSFILFDDCSIGFDVLRG